jgi:protein-tyrosine phosphatase
MEQYKIAGQRSYLNIFHSRGKNGKGTGACKGKGNSINTRKRNLPESRCRENRYKSAVRTNHIVDTYAETSGKGGTIKAQSLCLKRHGTNTQIHGPPTLKPNHDLLRPPPREGRCTDVPLVHPNLWIGDINSINQWGKEKEKVIVINLTDNAILDCSSTVHVPFRDSRMTHFGEFYQSFLRVKELLDEHLNSKKVILVCQAGVNRSSAMAVAYAISRGLKCNEMIEYLADRKYVVSPNWDNLTNTKFRLILRQLQSRPFIAIIHEQPGT